MVERGSELAGAFLFEEAANASYNYTTVQYVDQNTVRLHSWLHSVAQLPRDQVRPTAFWDTLRGFPNQSLWTHLDCDGDGEWIQAGIRRGSLCIVHGGSYMRELTEKVCSASVYIYCKATGQKVKCGVTDHSSEARNYR